MRELDAGAIMENSAEPLESLNSMVWLTMPQLLRKAAVIAGLIVFDLLSMALVLAVSVEIRLHMLPLIYPHFPEKLPPHLMDWGWVFLALWVLCLYYEGLYTARMPFWQESRKTIRAVTLTFVLALAGVSLIKLGGEISRTVLLLGYLLALPAAPLGRYLGKSILVSIGLWDEPLLVAGSGLQARKVAEALTKDRYLGYTIRGFITVTAADSGTISINGRLYPVLGTIDDLPAILYRYGIHHMVIAEPDLPGQQLVATVNQIQPYTRSILVVPDLAGIPVIGAAEYFFDERLLAFRTHNNLASRANVISKRVFDIAVGSLLLFFLAPLLIIIAVLIRLETPGPVIFAHRRLGKNGREFRCYKFRSMIVNAGGLLQQLLEHNPALLEQWKKDFKLKDDPRVTRIGYVLRKTSLDEIPQLFNVLKGEMSLVGPRPIIYEEMDRFGERARDYMMVLPGITGLWQVSGRSDIDYQERVLMDSWYVRNWSLWLDISLLFKTIGVVWSRKGAY